MTLDSKGGGMMNPTMILEVGVSESYRQLQGDIVGHNANTLLLHCHCGAF